MRLIGPEVIMIKRIGFILLLCCGLAWAYSQGARPAVELDHSVRLWGYELRFGLLLEIAEIGEAEGVDAELTLETPILPADTLQRKVVRVAGEVR